MNDTECIFGLNDFCSTFLSLSFTYVQCTYYKKKSRPAILCRKHFHMVITKIDQCAMLKLECSQIHLERFVDP